MAISHHVNSISEPQHQIIRICPTPLRYYHHNATPPPILKTRYIVRSHCCPRPCSSFNTGSGIHRPLYLPKRSKSTQPLYHLLRYCDIAGRSPAGVESGTRPSNHRDQNRRGRCRHLDHRVWLFRATGRDAHGPAGNHRPSATDHWNGIRLSRDTVNRCVHLSTESQISTQSSAQGRTASPAVVPFAILQQGQ